MKINKVLDDFVKECSKKLNLKCIIQFGSSTYSKDFQDIDLAFISDDLVFATKDYLCLLGMIKKYELKHKDVVFDIGGGERKRKGKYSITIVPLNYLDIGLIKKGEISFDDFFFKNLSEDKNKKILYGKDPTNFKVELSNFQIAQILRININHALRKFLDDNKRKRKATYHLFKTTLRLMLIKEGILKKESLLSLFRKVYGEKIKLPKESERILANDLKEKDFEDVLKFSEDCLRFSIK